MAARTTLFMTPEETERVQRTAQDHVGKCQAQTGQLREPEDPKSLVQQAVGKSVMDDFAAAAFGLGTAPKDNSQETMPAYAVGCPYSPCTADLADLEPMKLSDLRMETHHRGRVISLRRISPVVKLKTSCWAVVQGEASDEAERLELFLHNSRNGQDMLDSGSIFLVKEPYYTLNNQGEPAIRVDHPSDIIILAYSDGPSSWRNKDSSHSSSVSKPASKCKEEGNAALGKKDYWRAHACYAEGLKSIPENENGTLRNDIYRNRSYVNLLLQRFDEAIADALSSLTNGADQEQKLLDAKAYSRAGSAAYGLGNFEAARNFFEQQEKLEPDNRLANINLRRIKMRLQEKETGEYDLKKVVGSLPKTQGRADVASFNGHTEIRESPGAGRGLFATRDIDTNEVIMYEKALCVVWSHDPEAFSCLTVDLRDNAAIRVFPAGLHKALVQKLMNNPSQIEGVLDLFGDYKGLGNKLHESDGRPVLDTFQIHDIIQRNAFGPGQQTEDEDISNASTGLWVRAAYINHSCVSNAKKDYVGDLMILRATRKIAAGEEITHSYDESSDYDARTAALKRTWGFKCQCKLCAAEEEDGPDVRKQRQKLEKEINTFLQKENPSQAKKVAAIRAKRLRQNLLDTYNEQRYKDLPRRALLGIEQWLQAALIVSHP
ncbi:TPR domain-containing protein [Arthroderma uncinatum]|uniref:TPR domain-containing protein n=1 Tax=Arthroderma uncinatum TaxID=74035 RepID=UPI00144A4F8B|nr:TPR domain-containing protein [Arthroderma uncinatum]KAF3492328.1 TPR domain-containing protein [Arthroderma uncinatum]